MINTVIQFNYGFILIITSIYKVHNIIPSKYLSALSMKGDLGSDLPDLHIDNTDY